MKNARVEGEEPVEGDQWQLDVVLQQDLLDRR